MSILCTQSKAAADSEPQCDGTCTGSAGYSCVREAFPETKKRVSACCLSRYSYASFDAEINESSQRQLWLLRAKQSETHRAGRLLCFASSSVSYGVWRWWRIGASVPRLSRHFSWFARDQRAGHTEMRSTRRGARVCRLTFDNHDHDCDHDYAQNPVCKAIGRD